MLAGTCTFCASRYCLKKCCGHAWTQQHKVAAAADNRRCHRKLCSFQATINPTASFSLLPKLSRHCQPYRALSSQQSHQENEKKNPCEGSICRRQWKKKTRFIREKTHFFKAPNSIKGESLPTEVGFSGGFLRLWGQLDALPSSLGQGLWQRN